TTTPLSLTGLLFASCSWSTGCRTNVTPLCALLDGAVVITSFVAVPAVPVAVNVTELPVKPLAVAVTVFVPTVFPRVHDVTVAIPLPFVATVVGLVGLRDPLPAVTANVTSTPATELPLASVTITAVGEATAVPAGAEAIVPVPAPPAWLPGLPAASRSCTPGCWPHATPLRGAAEGGVVRVSWAAAPAARVMVLETTLANPEGPKLRVYVPGVPV